MPRYPEAEWVPWLWDGGSGPAYYKGLNRPEAIVLHIQQGFAPTARYWAGMGHNGASWHFTVTRDGLVWQHLDFEDGGYHAGIPDSAPEPTWPLWKGDGRNVNLYSIGIEHSGFTGTPFTPEQAAASKRLCQWLAAELDIALDEDHFPPHAAIDVVNRTHDFNSPELRTEFYQYLATGESLEEEMSPEERNMLRIAGGPYDMMAPCYDVWLDAGMIQPEDPAQPVPRAGEDDQASATVKRFAIIYLAGHNAKAAIALVQ